MLEQCAKDGSAKVIVKLGKEIELKAGASLRVYGLGETPVISKTAADSENQKVKEFSGASAVGCLPAKAMVSLVHDPGGLLNTLLTVLGKGVVEDAEERRR